MSDADNGNLEEKLRAVFETLAVANTLTEPMKRSIENLLKISAAELKSEEASVIVRDGEAGDLKFLTAIGQVAEQLIDIKIPAGKGIAGFVFSSGQPMAIADVGEQESFYAEVDRQTGHSTQTILAVPLRHHGEIIGVLEYINRTGEPPFEPFTPSEMDKAALFAEAVSSMVNAYELAKLFNNISAKMLSGDEKSSINEMREWLKTVRESNEYKEMLEMALMIREIANRGDAERRLCIEILEAFLRYSDDASETSYLNFS